MKIHYGVIETDGEMNTVVNKRAICGLTMDSVEYIQVSEVESIVTCIRCKNKLRRAKHRTTNAS
jgi:hypothetical protein